MLSHAVVIAKSDSTWKVTQSDPLTPDVFTMSAYDDFAWENATLTYDVGDYIPGYVAQGIWTSGGQFSTTETTI